MYPPTLADRITGSVPLRRRQALGRGMGRALGRIQVCGLELVPATGPVVLAVNHRSLLDGFLVFGAVSRPVNWVVKDEAFTPVVGPILRSAGQVPVVRGRVDRAPIRTCLAVLAAGGVVGIFPEGSRGHGSVHAAKPGVGYLALRSGATVVPVACHGTDAMTHRRTVRRPQARLIFGRPFAVEQHPVHRPLNRRLVAQTTERIRVALAGLVAETSLRSTRKAAA